VALWAIDAYITLRRWCAWVYITLAYMIALLGDKRANGCILFACLEGNPSIQFTRSLGCWQRFASVSNCDELDQVLNTRAEWRASNKRVYFLIAHKRAANEEDEKTQHDKDGSAQKNTALEYVLDLKGESVYRLHDGKKLQLDFGIIEPQQWHAAEFA
jgi:hypothetical protein